MKCKKCKFFLNKNGIYVCSKFYDKDDGFYELACPEGTCVHFEAKEKK